MSHIPNSAMPHAGATTDQTDGAGGRFGRLSEIRSDVTEMVREHPKTAAAAGAAVAAGVVAAAAIPVIRRSREKSDQAS